MVTWEGKPQVRLVSLELELHLAQSSFSIFPTWVILKRLCVEQFLVHLVRIMRKAGLLDETLEKAKANRKWVIERGRLNKVGSPV